MSPDAADANAMSSRGSRSERTGFLRSTGAGSQVPDGFPGRSVRWPQMPAYFVTVTSPSTVT